MKAIHVRVVLFDPVTEETFPVHEGLEVFVARRDRETGRADLDRIPLAWDEGSRCFAAPAQDTRTGRDHFLVVRFHARNFCKRAGRLLDLEEAAGVEGPLWAPSRFPDWDSGWDDGYRHNEHFGWRGRQRASAPDDPILLNVPIRRLYVVGHRGAPHVWPENTLASFGQALDDGANGIELDLCLLADGDLAVFHDPQPVKQPPRIDRTLFERLPYELVSPRFSLTGLVASLYDVEDGRVVLREERRLRDRRDLDLVRLTGPETREAYRYAPVQGTEHRLVDFDAFLDLAEAETDRLRLLFLDVKPPGRLADPGPAFDLGRRIGEALRRRATLPERVVVAYADPQVLRRLRAGVRAAGETRCWFAFDAAGGVLPWLRGVGRGWTFLPAFLRRWLGRILPGVPDPTKVARRLRTEVVSVGRLARAAHLEEIRAAVRDRDYRPRSRIDLVVHWTLNDPEDWAHSVSSGVNAILTDHPGPLVDWLASQGVRVG